MELKGTWTYSDLDEDVRDFIRETVTEEARVVAHEALLKLIEEAQKTFTGQTIERITREVTKRVLIEVKEALLAQTIPHAVSAAQREVIRLNRVQAIGKPMEDPDYEL